MESFFDQIQILPRALLIEGANDMPISRLRGLWGGRGIMDLDPAAYDAVFREPEGTSESGTAPAYVLADGGHPAPGLRLLHWTLIGRDAIARDEVLRRAWDIAGAAGTGAERFAVRDLRPFSPRGDILPPGFTSTGWPLAHAQWPLTGPPESKPCVLAFPNGLHLVEKVGGRERFQTIVTFDDIISAARARLARWLPLHLQAPFNTLGPKLEEHAAEIRATVRLKRGQPDPRGNGKTPRDYPVLHGEIRLPQGPGPLWPLLLAIRWLHLGKHSAEGIGRMELIELTTETESPKPKAQSDQHQKHPH